MSGHTSRRDFLVQSTLAALAAGTNSHTAEAQSERKTETPGAPPVLGVLPPVGPAVSPQTFAEAEKLMQVSMTAQERAEAAGSWRTGMAALVERRVGPRKVPLGEKDVPATTWNPALFRGSNDRHPPQGKMYFEPAEVPPLPQSEAEIAFASVRQLGGWLRTRQLTSERLTRIYLDRLRRYDPLLHCVITLTEEHALQQARQADAQIASGRYRGPLHGIPYGAKDLLDTAGIPTTYGAEPFRDRVPQQDSAVIQMLNRAGAVLVAKLSLGALALNDIWFGGQTRNPWLTEEGSSGSSAGPASAVSAGLVAFAIGSETQGSIISPSMRCGVTGLRPTYGRVSTSGAMTLSWTCDKLGPMARDVESALLVLNQIGNPVPDTKTGSPVPPLDFDSHDSAHGLRVGYFPQWMKEAPATDVDRATLEAVKRCGMQVVEVSLPDWPYDSLNVILFAEAAAAFEEITLDHRVDQLKMQVPDAWPNSFRQARFLSAVDLVQADRLRRKVAIEMSGLMQHVDLLLVPSLRDEMMVISNFTGHPSLTLPAGFVEVSEARSDWAPDPERPLPRFSPPRRVPHGVTLIGRLYEEGTLARAGIALQREFGMTGKHPPQFA